MKTNRFREHRPSWIESAEMDDYSPRQFCGILSQENSESARDAVDYRDVKNDGTIYTAGESRKGIIYWDDRKSMWSALSVLNKI